MKKVAGILILFLISNILGSSTIQTVEDRFWNWFVKNQEILYSDEIRFISDPDLKVFKKLEDRLNAIDINLKFIIGKKDNSGVKKFIVSART